MSTHELRSGDRTRTALNDNNIYAVEQAKYRAELERFAWTWDEGVDVRNEVLHPNRHHVNERPVRLGRSMGPTQNDAGESMAEAVDQHPESPYPWSTSDAHLPGGRSSPAPASNPASSSPLLLPATMQSMPSIPSLRIESPTPSHRNTPPATSPLLLPRVTGAGVIEGTNPVPIKPARPEKLNLMPGMPSSGLSVSDIISVSPGLGSLTRLIRRHPHIPTDESASMARLSVELDGYITGLDDEDWEALEVQPGETAPNGEIGHSTPSSFFGRGLTQVLRHRVSNIGGSALRVQRKASNPSRESSPSNSRPVTGLFAAKSLESTKKALEKLKTFPRLRKRSQNGKVTPLLIPPIEKMPTLPLDSVSAPQPIAARPAALTKPAPTHRITESGWFDMRPRVRKQISSTATQLLGSWKMEKSASDSSSSLGGTVGKVAPKVELMQTAPISWEVEGGNTLDSKPEREHVVNTGR